MSLPLLCRADDGFSLIAELCGKFPVCGHHLGGRMNLFSITRRVGRDLSGLETCPARSLEVGPDLLAARTRCVKILLGVAFDLWRPTPTSCDFVA